MNAPVPTDSYAAASVSTKNRVTTSVPTEYSITASIRTSSYVSHLNFLSRNQVGESKWSSRENKRLSEISIANTKNEIISIVYHMKTELYGKKLQVRFLWHNIDAVFIKKNLPNDHKITTTLGTDAVMG